MKRKPDKNNHERPHKKAKLMVDDDNYDNNDAFKSLLTNNNSTKGI